VQAGAFDDVVDGARFIGTEPRVNFLAAAGEGFGDDQIRCCASG